MFILTKKYRLVWDVNTKELLTDPSFEYDENTKTKTNGLGNYDSDSFNDILNKINEENLYFESIDEK